MEALKGQWPSSVGNFLLSKKCIAITAVSVALVAIAAICALHFLTTISPYIVFSVPPAVALVT